MEERRAISKKIISSAKFLMMPTEVQALYFHLVINADDDGTVEAYAVMMMTGTNEQHLRLLEQKGFIKIFNTELVSQIVHWKEHKEEVL
jgi:hypothetical protein